MSYNYKCSECQKDFSQTAEVYKWGKDKCSFCQSCNEKNRKKCSWCEKDLNCQPSKFSKLGCGLHNHHKSHRWGDDGSNEYEYEVFCDQNCEIQFDQYQENKPERIAEHQKGEALLKKGYKPCQGEGPFPFLAGLEKCGSLISPNEKLCESCQKRQHEQEKRREVEKDLAERKKEYDKKYQQAQNWWNSLSHAEKQKQIRDLEEKWQKEGWGSRLFYKDLGDKSSDLEFKNGKIYYDNLMRVPPPFLENFGIGCDYSEYTSNGSKVINGFQAKLNNLETKLQDAKKSGNKTEISNLEREIQSLKKQKENSDNKETQNLSPKHSYWPWIIGISIVSLIVLGFWIARRKRIGKSKK